MSLLEPLYQSNIFSERFIFKRNEYVKLPHTVDSKIYYIKSGSVKISIYNNDEEQIIRFGYNGDLIVALDSFITEQNSEFFIQVIKKSEIWIGKKQDFINWIYSSAENIDLYIKILEDLVLQQIEREKDLLVESPKIRFERVFERNPKLFQIIPNKHIANYLRMSPETLSRLKKR